MEEGEAAHKECDGTDRNAVFNAAQVDKLVTMAHKAAARRMAVILGLDENIDSLLESWRFIVEVSSPMHLLLYNQTIDNSNHAFCHPPLTTRPTYTTQHESSSQSTETREQAPPLLSATTSAPKTDRAHNEKERVDWTDTLSRVGSAATAAARLANGEMAKWRMANGGEAAASNGGG